MKNKLHEGKVMDFLAGADYDAGDIVNFGVAASGFGGVCVADIANGARGSVAIGAVYEFTKTTEGGSGASAGAAMYHKAATGASVTATSTSNHKIGVLMKTTIDSDTVAEVLLVPGS